jgi:hypothetical protein
MPPPCFSALPRGGKNVRGEKRYRKIWCTKFRRQFFWTREFMDNAPQHNAVTPERCA